MKGVKTLNRIDRSVIDQMYKEGWLYASFGEYFRRTHGYKVFKVPVDAGFVCPNWDGRISRKGCIYCPSFAVQFSHESFRSVMREDLKKQVSKQIEYHRKKGAGKKFFVYVAFGTNTYERIETLKKIYDALLEHPDVVGLSIGTRPDCLPDEVFDLLEDYVKEGYEIWLEIGQQSMHYSTEKNTNRGHGVSEIIRVVREAKKRDILTLAFVILGLPYETPEEMIETARMLSALGIDAVKIYPLLVMKNTKLLEMYKKYLYRPLGEMEYISLLADFIEHLSPYVLIQRVSKDNGLDGKIAPCWDTFRFHVFSRLKKVAFSVPDL